MEHLPSYNMIHITIVTTSTNYDVRKDNDYHAYLRLSSTMPIVFKRCSAPADQLHPPPAPSSSAPLQPTRPARPPAAGLPSWNRLRGSDRGANRDSEGLAEAASA